MTRCKAHALLYTALVGLSLAGCQRVDSLRRTAEDVNPQRRLRRAEMVEHFERQRDLADLQVAQEQWQRGDLAGCNSTLFRLLQRTPRHIEANLLLAELRMEQGRGGEVLSDLQSLAAAHPADARLQFVTGLLLDTCGDAQAAIPYYAEAAQLAPRNELYTKSHFFAVQPGTSLASADHKPSPPGTRCNLLQEQSGSAYAVTRD